MAASLQDDCLRLLVQVGFTETQAKVYLALSTTGQTDAKNLAKQANVPRQATYRTLGELQEKGIVEKIITIPQQYKAVPFSDGLGIMISTKAKEYAHITQKAKEFLLKYEIQKQAKESEKDYHISILEGKETIINRIGILTAKSTVEICVCQTLQRWIHVNTEIADIVMGELKKGVKYRSVIEHTEGEISIPKDLKPILKHPNYQIRVIREKLKINAALYDDNVGCFSFYPARSVSETPVIVTNHPSLLVGFRDHFENLWRDSEKLDLKGIFK
jgi:sugar-specific transcriptional regulator TrmB